MSKIIRNPFSGRNCSGYRFKFLMRSFAHCPLFLPLEMKSLPQIQMLMQGLSPLDVFSCDDIDSARRAFSELRKKYDFDFWAANEFFIHDIEDPDNIVPLILNDRQHFVVDILRKRYFNRQCGRYVVSKSSRRCGLTTCIQAYILWKQTYQRTNNSYTCAGSDIGLFPLKSNLCRYLKRDVIPPDMWIFLPKVDGNAFFNTFRSPNAIRGINLGFVHFADMSRWNDPTDRNISRAYSACVSAVLLDYFTLVILEGNVPRGDSHVFQQLRRVDPRIPYRKRITGMSGWFRNPFFMNEVVYASSNHDGHFLHIDLDKAIL